MEEHYESENPTRRVADRFMGEALARLANIEALIKEDREKWKAHDEKHEKIAESLTRVKTVGGIGMALWAVVTKWIPNPWGHQ